MVNLLPTIRLAQSILKRKFPSVDKPLKKGPLKKYKPQGLFSEFYGTSEKRENKPRGLCIIAKHS